jgi:hypothetical protein
MKTIPIFPGADACDESSGEVQKVNKPLTRRSFLKGSAVLRGTIAATSVLYALAPSPVWAAPLQLLSEEEGATIMHMGRVLYPHDKLPDAVYALLAKDLGADASADAAVAAQLRAGIQELNRMDLQPARHSGTDPQLGDRGSCRFQVPRRQRAAAGVRPYLLFGAGPGCRNQLVRYQ